MKSLSPDTYNGNSVQECSYVWLFSLSPIFAVWLCTYVSKFIALHVFSSHSTCTSCFIPLGVTQALVKGVSSGFSQGCSEGEWAPNLGCKWVEAPEGFDVSPKSCTRHDVWEGAWSWWSCQSPVAHSCSLLNHPNSFHRGIFKLSTKFDADLLLY